MPIHCVSGMWNCSWISYPVGGILIWPLEALIEPEILGNVYYIFSILLR